MSRTYHRHHAKNIDNTGFGPNSTVEGGRLINPDGTANLKKVGIPFWDRISLYHTLLRMKRSHFLAVIFFFYTGVNFVFAVLYLTVGVQNLGIEMGGTVLDHFVEAFFFSSQTMTTVGYGKVAPSGFLANLLASIESLLGILSFAVVTGLIYGRFSRPRAYLIFSDNIIVAPYREGLGLMFRVASYKNNHLTDVEVNATLALHEMENGKPVTKFFQLQPEMAKINSLSLSWTIVHAINEDSPLINYTREDVVACRMEVIVTIKAFDDHFSNLVQQRTSYTYNQLIYGARFLPMFERATDGSKTLLELDKINRHELVDISALRPAAAVQG